MELIKKCHKILRIYYEFSEIAVVLWQGNFENLSRSQIKVIHISYFIVLIIVVYYIKLSVPGPGPRPDLKPIGLINTRNTCYMNSIVQAIASSSTVMKGFHELHKKVNNKLLEVLIDLLGAINKPESNAIANTDKLNDLVTKIKWQKTAQQDSFDFLAATITRIERNIKSENCEEKFQMPMKIKLVHRFTGMDIPDKIQDHLGLSVGLCGKYSKRPGESLEYLIKEHFSQTIIDDDPKKTTQMFFYQEAPDVLLIHIQANKWDHERGEMYKPEYYVTYDEKIELDVEIIRKDEVKPIKETANYDLIAVTKHMGSISGGHYVTYRKYEDQWYLANDEQIEKTKFDKTIVPYIMIYEKARPPVNKSPSLFSNKKYIEMIINLINCFDKG